MTRLGAALAGLALAAFALRAAAAPPLCSQETLMVRGMPVTLGYCLTAPPRPGSSYELVVPVYETFRSPGGSFDRPAELHFFEGEGVSRVLESVPLSPLGMRGVLHLTLTYSGGLVRIEGALLTPGAITIK